jgi:hypothetical protein
MGPHKNSSLPHPSGLPQAAKRLSVIVMWAGRLEIVPVIALVARASQWLSWVTNAALRDGAERISKERLAAFTGMTMRTQEY